MNGNENNKPVRRVDPSELKDGRYIAHGNLYESDGTLIGPIPMKEYLSVEEWGKDLQAQRKNEDLSCEEEEDIDFKTDFSVDKKDTIYNIAKHLIEEHHIKTISGKKMREVFVYKDGIYVSGEDMLKKEIQELLEELCTTHYSKEIIEAIKNLSIKDRKEFSVDKNLINFNNGVLNIRTGERMDHNPNNLFFNKIPIDYVLDADCLKIKKFLSEILDEDAISVIQEWFGYAMYRSYFIKKAIIFVGEGDTGKTTLINLLEWFIGKDNISGVSLQKITSDKFAAANFFNKHINSVDDLSFNDISDNGAFKMATGGGSITGEFKFGNQFQFENYAKLTFACNKVPEVKDLNDAAYFGRWIVIHFRNVVEKPDKFLFDKITTSEEMSGLLNFALDGLRRLLTNQRFSYDKEPHEIRCEMALSGSVVAKFSQNCLSEAVGKWISKDDMYEAFVRYACSEKLPADTKENFGRKIRNYADYIIDSKSLQTNPLTNNKVQTTGWRNVAVNVRFTGSTDNTHSLEPSEEELNAVLNDEYQQEAEQQSLML